mgnify:CR=1 FL=1
MKRYVTALIMMALLIYTAMIYGSAPIAMFVFCLFLLMLVSLVYMNLIAADIEPVIRIPIALAEKGQKVLVNTEIHNHSGKNNRKIGYQVSVNFQGKEQEKRWIYLDMESGVSENRQFEIGFFYAGSYEIILNKIRVYDMTGFFYLNRKVTKRVARSIEVLPEMEEMPVRLTEPVRNFFGEAEVYDELRSGDDVNEVFQIRPFQNGDKVQSIHWKISARMDELMIKESSHPKACPVALLLDFRGKNTGKDAVRKKDIYYRAAASISYSLMDAGCPHYVAWFSGQTRDLVRIRVDDEESFYQFLAFYLHEKEEKVQEDMQALYKEKYGSERILHHIVLNEKMEIRLDEKLLQTIRKDHEKEDIHELELIL